MDSETRLDRAFPAQGNQTLGVGRLLQRGVDFSLDTRWKWLRSNPFDHLAGCPGLALHGQRNRATRTGTLEYTYLRLPIRCGLSLLCCLSRLEFLDTLRVERVRGLVTLAALQLLGPFRVLDTQVGIQYHGEDDRLDACILLIGIDTGTQENHVPYLGWQRRDTGEGVHDVKRVLRSVAWILVNEVRRIVKQKFIISHDCVHTFSGLGRGRNGRVVLVL